MANPLLQAEMRFVAVRYGPGAATADLNERLEEYHLEHEQEGRDMRIRENFDGEENAGKPCPGCGSGDQVELADSDGAVIDGQAFHNLECAEAAGVDLSHLPAWARE